MEDNSLDFGCRAQQYRRMLSLCRQLEDKKHFLHQRMVQLRDSHDPRKHAVVPLINAQLRQLDEGIWQMRFRMSDAAHRLDRAIVALRDERLELILRCRYLELMTWDEISEATGLGLRWLHRLHNKGLDMLRRCDLNTPAREIPIDTALNP